MERAEVIKDFAKNNKNSKMLVWVIILLFVAGVVYLFFISGGNSLAGNKGDTNNKININPDLVQVYFFWSATCPHCAEQKPFMENLKNKYQRIQLFSYEVQFDKENAKLFKKFEEDFGVPKEQHGWVPATFVGEDYFIGFNEATAADIENKVVQLINSQ